MSNIEFITLQAASEAFTVEPLPNNWLEMSDGKKKTWLENHMWEPLENYDASEYYELIEVHSNTIKYTINKVLEELKEQLVQAAIMCELPGDLNELDLQTMLGME